MSRRNPFADWERMWRRAPPGATPAEKRRRRKQQSYGATLLWLLFGTELDSSEGQSDRDAEQGD